MGPSPGTRRRGPWPARAAIISVVLVGLLSFAVVRITSGSRSGDSGAPSLVLRSVGSLPDEVAPGHGVRLTAAVRNPSGRPLVGHIVVRLSGAPANEREHIVARMTLTSVGPRATGQFHVEVVVPAALASGSYPVTACVYTPGFKTGNCKKVDRPLRVLEPGTVTTPPSPMPTTPTTVRSSSPDRPPDSLPVGRPTGTVFQTIDGFGTSERVFTDPHVFDADVFNESGVVPTSAALQDAVLDALYVDLGLTRVRPVQPDTRSSPSAVGIEISNDNGDPTSTDLTRFDFSGRRVDDHAALIARAKARGVTVAWTSPLNREPWMGVTPGSTDVAEYSEWLLAQVRRFSQRGARLDYLSVANEPSFSRNPMSGEFIRDVIKDLGPRLRAEGLLVPFVIPDDVRASDGAAKAAVVLADPVARQYVGALATHLYDEPVAAVAAMRTIAERYDLPLWMSEFSVIAIGTTRQHEAGTPTPLDWAVLMHELLTTYNVSAIDYLWGFISAGDGLGALVQLDRHATNGPGFTRSKLYYYFGQYSRFVRPGAQRVGMTSSDTSVRASAYVRGTTRTIVAINPGPAPVTTTLEVPDLAGVGRLAQTRTSESESWATPSPVPVNGKTVTVTLAPQSVTTLNGTTG